jgi:hypothetical protein
MGRRRSVDRRVVQRDAPTRRDQPD